MHRSCIRAARCPCLLPRGRSRGLTIRSPRPLVPCLSLSFSFSRSNPSFLSPPTLSSAASSSLPRSTISQDWRNWLICIVPSVCLFPIMCAMDHSRAIQEACESKRVAFGTYSRYRKAHAAGLRVCERLRTRNGWNWNSWKHARMTFFKRSLLRIIPWFLCRAARRAARESESWRKKLDILNVSRESTYMSKV